MEKEELQQLTFDFFTEQPRITAQDKDQLSLSLGQFAGPLDLLLFLIKQEQANIFDIPIAKITDEYLRYLRVMKKLDITVAGDFLVMAATLIEIKSKMLLPKEVSENPEEEIDDPRKELVDRLLEHQKFKNAAQMLWEKNTIEQSIFSRGRIESDENNMEINASIFDLYKVFQKILARHKEEVEMEIERDELTLSEMLANLKKLLSIDKVIKVSDFFALAHSRRELVVAFLAVLEIVKSESVRLLQEKVFGEIILRQS